MFTVAFWKVDTCPNVDQVMGAADRFLQAGEGGGLDPGRSALGVDGGKWGIWREIQRRIE